jgi:hypothetical protein
MTCVTYFGLAYKYIPGETKENSDDFPGEQVSGTIKKSLL